MTNNNKPPFISIIVPTYNLEDCISEAIDSVLAQEDYSNFEILIVDDNSTDNTFNIITNYANNDPRIKVFINKRRKGAAGARNTGLENAKGEWIAFLDGDDLWDKRILATQINVLKKYPDVQLITSDFYRLENNVITLQTEVDPVWSKYFYQANKSGELLRLNNPVRCFLEDRVLTRTGILLIKHELLKRVGFFDEEIMCGEDFLLYIKLAKCVDYMIYVPKPLMTYRIRPVSLTNTGIPYHTLFGVILLKKLLNLPDFKEYKKSIKKQIGLSILRNTYYYRETGKKFKAICSAVEGVFYCAKDLRSWKNLVASLLFF